MIDQTSQGGQGTTGISATRDDLLSLPEAARCLPKVNGRRPSLTTLWRWCRVGVRGVQLQYVRLGRRICTTRESLDRFTRALADADATDSTITRSRRDEAARETSQAPRTDRHRTRAIEEAEAQCDDTGI